MARLEIRFPSTWALCYRHTQSGSTYAMQISEGLITAVGAHLFVETECLVSHSVAMKNYIYWYTRPSNPFEFRTRSGGLWFRDRKESQGIRETIAGRWGFHIPQNVGLLLTTTGRPLLEVRSLLSERNVPSSTSHSDATDSRFLNFQISQGKRLRYYFRIRLLDEIILVDLALLFARLANTRRNNSSSK
jgi:hypothetical protein